MHDIKPVIQLAKERALFRFSALALRMTQDASTSIAQLTATARSAAEQTVISTAKEWLAMENQVFLKRLYASYFSYVEHAMETMYRDLRQGLRDVSADTWALIDDDTITRQIEVERRVLRLRDADQQSLGRLNLMIAQLHDEHEVRERENPFRPYLMARALHDVLREMTSNTDVCTLLFDHMSSALAEHLPEYFAAIREVFESNGVHARLLARPTALTKRDRQMLAMPDQPISAPVHVAGTSFQNGFSQDSAAVSPALERVLSLLQQRSETNGAMPVLQQDSQDALQDFVRKIFIQSAPSRMPAYPRYQGNGTEGAPRSGDSAQDARLQPHPLTSQLHRLQQEVVNGDASTREAAPDSAGLLDLHEVLETDRLSDLDRIAMDVVAMLFDFIGRETLIPDTFRTPIVQLQVPFLKATMFDPLILQQADHPVRQLLNRMASVAIGLDVESRAGREIRTEMGAITGTILNDFKLDMSIFSDALTQFDAVVEKALRSADSEAARAVNALESAEKDPQQHEVLLVQTINALRERLLTIQTDRRAADFIVKIWSRVLVHVKGREDIDSKPYRDVVPDLIWSVQEELDANGRNALMKLLPKLVQRVRDGLQLIGMSETDSRQVMDELVAMHAQVLRTIQADPVQTFTPLESLHRHFSTLVIGSAEAETADVIHAPTVPQIRLQAALQKFDVSAHLYLDSDVGTLQGSDIKWLGGMQPGISVEWWVDNGYLPATLLWVNQRQSFYLFKLNEPGRQPGLLIYSSISLIKALREGSMGMIEYAPIFDRAIESLLNTEEARQPSLAQ